MSVVVMIPARYASVRYPGKPLVPLTGADGQAKTLIERSWEAARAAGGIDEIYVTTDDERIRAASEGFGARVAMTSEECANGTERCAEAIETLGIAPEIVVNLQGDAPLTPPWFVEALVGAMRADPAIQVATPVLRCDHESYESFAADRRAGRVGATTVVFGNTMDALYFSKEIVPYLARPPAPGAPVPVFHHVGIYAYRPAALALYRSAVPGPLEGLEGLEQLRFLENGVAVRCVEVEARGRAFWELNNPVDVERIEAVLKAEGLP
ncbi:MAG: manno-octulosonate cytidylyltransferase [Pseudomonadota bacterium]